MKLKKAALLFHLLLISFLANSQLVLGIAEEVSKKSATNFHISQIIDSTKSTTIGRVFLADKKRTMPVKIFTKADKYFTEFARKLYVHQHAKDSIVLIINNLKLSESESEDILRGGVWLTISYYLQHEGIQTLLLNKTTSIIYKRTFGSATPKSFEELLAAAFTKNIDFFSSWKTLNHNYHPAFISKSEVIIQPRYLQNVDDTIYYNSRPITWADFKGEAVNRGTKFAAAIFPNIAFDLEMEIKNRILKAYFTPKVYMVQGMSWVKDNALDDYSLEHEKLHFDIANVAMNKMIKKITKIEAKTFDDLQSRIQYEYIEAYREMNRLQTIYDDETGHGLNKLTQEFWKTQVSGWSKE